MTRAVSPSTNLRAADHDSEGLRPNRERPALSRIPLADFDVHVRPH
jgi:hypothetical protein